MHVACAIESRDPRPEINPEVPPVSETWINQFAPRRVCTYCYNTNTFYVVIFVISKALTRANYNLFLAEVEIFT